MMEEQDSYKVIATKVSPDVKVSIGNICSRLGMNEYQLLQMMCDCIVRYMDDRHNLTPEMERVMAVFEYLSGWKDAVNFADPTAMLEVVEAIYFLADTHHRKHGVRAVHVERPFMGQWKQNKNLQQIFERAVELLMPERYRRLRSLATDLHCSSMLDLLDHLIDLHTKDSDTAELRRLFEDSARAANNKPVAYGQNTRRSQHYDIDGRGAQRKFEFESEPEV